MFYPCIDRVNPALMDAEVITVPRPPLEARGDDRVQRPGPQVLEPTPNGLADRFSRTFGPQNPIRVFVVALLAGYALLVTAMVFLGLVLIHVLLPLGGLGAGRRGLQPLVGRQPVIHAGTCLVGRIHARRGSRDSGGDRRLSRDLLAHATLAPRRLHPVRRRGRVGDLSRDVDDRRAPAPGRAATREPARRRQLPLRSHRRIHRAVRGPSPPAGVADPQRRRPCARGRGRRRDPRLRRVVAGVSRDAPPQRRGRWSAARTRSPQRARLRGSRGQGGDRASRRRHRRRRVRHELGRGRRSRREVDGGRARRAPRRCSSEPE